MLLSFFVYRFMNFTQKIIAVSWAPVASRLAQGADVAILCSRAVPSPRVENSQPQPSSLWPPWQHSRILHFRVVISLGDFRSR